ncbi:MAG: hypothetical protein UR26_C0003G0056 [candidate division TM6 bacterium GW2011_GWF2_32_72]|nr:MAG: hypothetical protein UR26_C0003G0056 [candidate division TM6 bacterium GW2011_GWF2_32_72]
MKIKLVCFYFLCCNLTNLGADKIMCQLPVDYNTRRNNDLALINSLVGVIDSLQNVESINLSGNNLKEIPTVLSLFSGLKVLDLSNNKLISLDTLYSLASLEVVYLLNNRGLKMEEIVKLADALPNLKIIR